MNLRNFEAIELPATNIALFNKSNFLAFLMNFRLFFLRSKDNTDKCKQQEKSEQEKITEKFRKK